MQRGSSEPLWRAIAVFRFASLGYAALRVAVIDHAEYSRPDWAWAVIAVMTAWTVVTTIAYARPERRTRLLLSADLAVTAGLLMSTAALQYSQAPGQQEAALRALVGSGAAGGPAGDVDLRPVLLSAQTDRATVSVPAQPVLLSKTAADELASATRAALDNVERHCGDGARAWVLVEDEPDVVTVTAARAPSWP